MTPYVRHLRFYSYYFCKNLLSLSHTFLDSYLQNFIQISEFFAIPFSASFALTYKLHYSFQSKLSSITRFQVMCFGQALDRLVTVSSICCHTSTSALSTLYSSRDLTHLKWGISHLEGGFTLRCLQRLSLPGLATLLCLW